MRILHYVDENRLSWSRPWLQLLEEIAKLEDDVEQLVLCRPGGTLRNQVESAGFEVYVYRPLMAWCPALCAGFGRSLGKLRPDIIHTRLSSAAAIAGYWGRKVKIPVISTVDKYPKARYYTKADCIVPSSCDVARYMEGLGFPAEKLRVITNAIRVAEYAPDSDERARVRFAAGVNDATPILLAMGRFVPWKGFDLFLQALESIECSEPIKVWIVGEGPMEDRLFDLGKGINSRRENAVKVSFFPFADDVRPYLRAADIFVQPSWHIQGSGGPETFSLALLEAQAAGLPAVVFDCGGAPDLIEDGFNGWVAVPGDVRSLKRVLEKALEEIGKKEFASRARERAEAHDVKRAAELHSEIYRSVHKGKSCRGSH
ncbi:MAG: glycosyltransferase family 4 protein [Thermovirgaceae bacterium]